MTILRVIGYILLAILAILLFIPTVGGILFVLIFGEWAVWVARIVLLVLIANFLYRKVTKV